VQYTVRALHEGRSWILNKRFSEFATLHELLRKRLPSVPDLPAKSVVRQFSSDYLESRKQMIQSYLNDLTNRRDVLNCPETWAFFGLADNVVGFRQSGSTTEPVQAAEVHEAAFGIVDFAYDPIQGLLLIGATDISWTSRMDTKITNIKLPWEPAAPNLPTSQLSLWRQSGSDLRFEMVFMCRYTASMSCVALSGLREKGVCICGLGDGTVGVASLKSSPGVNTTEATLPLLRHTAGVAALAFDDQEQWVISASKDNSLKIYDTRRQMVQSESQTPAPTTCMHYCQVLKRLFTGLSNGRIVMWDLGVLPAQQLCTIPDGADMFNGSKITALDYDSVTNTLFTSFKDGFALFAVKSGASHWARCVGQIGGISNAPSAVAWANSSREILGSFGNGTVAIFDVDKGEATYVIQAHKEEVTQILWLDAPRRLLTASKDKTLKIWDFPSLRKAPLDDTSFAGPAPVSISTSRSGDRGGGDPLGSSSRIPAGLSSSSISQDPLRNSFGGSYDAPPPRTTPTVNSTSSRPTATSSSAARPRVQGAPPNAVLRDDSSDDDLKGWDQ
jgi:WD40 repeat protein